MNTYAIFQGERQGGSSPEDVNHKMARRLLDYPIAGE
jgi:hypothetical protein